MLRFFSFCLLLSCTTYAQTGSVGDPFTALGQAQTVSTPGVYHFNFGEPFATYVDANGYVQVALDFGDGVGDLPTQTDLPPTTRGILSTAALATLTDVAEIRISCSVAGALDATTTDTTLIERVRTKQTLFKDHLDNDYNNGWTGTGAAYLTADADPNFGTRPQLGLAAEVYHTFYNTSGLHWIPQRPEQGLGHQNNIPAADKLTLWVRAADFVPTPGSVYLPFKSLQEAADNVTTAGTYYFDLGGVAFRTYVDTAGYVQVARDFGTQAAPLTQLTVLPDTVRGILAPAVLAQLSGIAEIRMTSSAGNLDATTSNDTLARRIRENRSLMSGQGDNVYNNDWVGTGASYLTADATREREVEILHEEIFHAHHSNGGLHWIPGRGDRSLIWNESIPENATYVLWVHGDCARKIAPPTVNLDTYTIPLCGTSTTVPPPTATDVCGNAVTGTTTDPVTFTTADTFRVNWTFTDPYGNTITVPEDVIVESGVLSLPLYETVESSSLSLGCWTAARGTPDSEGGWTVSGIEGVGSPATAAFYLPAASVDSVHSDFLLTPQHRLLPGQEYELSFFSRAVGQENLDVRLIRASDYATVKQLSYDDTLVLTYERAMLRFTVATDDIYRIAFGSISSGGRQGLAIDEVLLDRYEPPTTGGAALLAGEEVSDNCLVGYGRGVNGEAWIPVYAASDPSRLLMEINPNGNTLGDITVQMTDYAGTPTGPFTGLPHLGRYYDITPQGGSGPYEVNGGPLVRLYFRSSELTELRQAYGRNFNFGDLTVSHYAGTATDCQIENSTDGTYATHPILSTQVYGGDAQYVEFQTTTFSEFGGFSEQGLPVTLRDFAATADGSANRIEWTVEQEVDFSHYVVERSTDGVNFTRLDRVAGGRPPRYLTRDPAPAALTYYRLQLVDLDGSADYSEVVSVRRADSASPTLTLHPNPTNGPLVISLHSPRKGTATYQLLNSLGQPLRRGRFAVRAGQQQHTLDLSDLRRGSYLLSVTVGGARMVRRVVRQ